MNKREFYKKVLQAVQKQKPARAGSIDYNIVVIDGRKVLFLRESNEPQDWLFNFAGISYFPRYHQGYLYKAIELKKLIDDKKLTVSGAFDVCGHSHGGSIALVFSTLYKKHFKNMVRCIVSAPCVTHSLFNFRKPKDCTIYFKKDDPVRFSWVLMFYRLPVKKTMLPETTGDSPIDSHKIPAYEKVL